MSHHPPITNFILEGLNGSYQFSGFFEYKVWPGGLNSIKGARVGKQIVSFADGGLISIKDPTIEIQGMAYGDRVFNLGGVGHIKDHINRIEAEITYNAQDEESSGYLKSFKSKIWGSSKPKKQAFTDNIKIEIFQTPDPRDTSGKRKVLAKGIGSWLSYIEFDGKPYWTIS